MNGEERDRDPGISQESYQRAKCLSHKAQIKLRSERLEQARVKQQEKISTKNARLQSYLDSNKQCEDRVLKEMAVSNGDDRDAAPISSLLENATLEHFKHCVVPQLATAFPIHALPGLTKTIARLDWKL